MALVKRLGVFILLGALIGDALATVLVPGYLAWWNTPGAGQALCNCPEIVKSTASSLIRAQLIGAAVGAVTFLILGLIWSRKKPTGSMTSAVPAQSPK